MKSIGMYIHIPFCTKKCPYCNFYSVKVEDALVSRYVDTVVGQIEDWSKKLDVALDSLYIGGGTPSSVGGAALGRIIDSVSQNFKLIDPEITVECNPSENLEDFCCAISEKGVNRISMGLQSAVDSERKSLGRRASPEDVARSIRYAKNAGIDNLSIDIMLGIPGQTKQSLQKTLDFCIDSDVRHVSAYMLKIEKKTPFYKIKDELPLPDEDAVSAFYLQACETLEKARFAQYEISNFAQKGFEGRHNLKYWNAEEYLGIGVSAHSFLNGERFFNEQNIHDYIKDCTLVKDGGGGTFDEYAVLRLRLTEGLVDEETFFRFNHDIPLKMVEEAEKLQKQGFLTCDDKGIRLTKKGFLVSNTIIFKLISALE